MVKNRTIAIWLTLAAALFLGACENEGPVEQAGENVDQAVEQAGDTIEGTADKMEEKTEN